MKVILWKWLLQSHLLCEALTHKQQMCLHFPAGKISHHITSYQLYVWGIKSRFRQFWVFSVKIFYTNLCMCLLNKHSGNPGSQFCQSEGRPVSKTQHDVFSTENWDPHRLLGWKLCEINTENYLVFPLSGSNVTDMCYIYSILFTVVKPVIKTECCCEFMSVSRMFLMMETEQMFCKALDVMADCL